MPVSGLEELNHIVPEAFLPFFIKTVGHFSKHMVRNRPDATAHFNKRNFCKAIESKSVRHFVKKFVQTQMFDLFIQEVEQRPASQTGKPHPLQHWTRPQHGHSHFSLLPVLIFYYFPVKYFLCISLATSSGEKKSTV